MGIAPRTVVEDFFRRIRIEESVEKIADLVSENVDWFVAGDTKSVPWIGHKIGKAGVAEFYKQIREQLEPEFFHIDEILTQGERVLVIGKLSSRVLKTGKRIETEFCFDLKVENGEITRFRMFEDSFAVAQAAQ